ncbi:MAG: leucine-rich repeat domain-containing protein [Bacteroides sp.]|nr:leucine-rich repeat domain-containing protein [Bacteroides sp.]
MKKLLLPLLGVFAAFPSMAQNFYCPVNDYASLGYNIVDESAKTCEVCIFEKNPNVDVPERYDIVIPSQVEYGDNEYTVVSIGRSVFMSYALSSISIPSTVTKIGEMAFYSNYSYGKEMEKAEFASIEHLCSIDFGDYYSNPAGGAKALYFAGEKVTDIVVPNTITEIKDYAFYQCNIARINIPSSVTSIGKSAFYRCMSLTSINIPSSVTSIGETAFYRCTSLRRVEFESLESLCNIDFCGADSNPLSCGQYLYVGGEEITNLVIPNTVKEIKDYVFSGCSKLTSIDIPNSVITIGESSFSDCSNVKVLNISESVTSIGANAFSSCGITSVVIPNSLTSIEDDVFRRCPLTSVVIPNAVTTIGDRAFASCSLTSIVIPDSVTSIGDYAFSGCPLTSVEIGKNVTYIGKGNFASRNLQTVKVYAVNPPEIESEGQFLDDTYDYATLYVPVGSESDYEAHACWGFFRNIETFDPDASIDDIEAGDVGCEVYTIGGLKVGDRIDGLPKGVYILRKGSTVTKMAI